MSTLELSKYIGQTGMLASDKLSFSVRILDAKLAWGNVRFQVSPVSGTGTVWVDSSRVQFDHAKVLHGLCDVCGHYGEDCTGTERIEL